MSEEEIKKSILDETFEVLDENNYDYTCDSVEYILNKYWKAKAALREILRKHPNWNEEKQMICFDADYNRQFSNRACANFRLYLRNNLGDDIAMKTLAILDFILDINMQYLDESWAGRIETLNSFNPEFKIRVGQKASKIINKICTVMGWNKFENFNQKYSELSDCINPIKVRRHTSLSINIIDYLLMSNGSNWKSCHNIHEPGCYSSGTISYALDNTTMIFYTVDASYNGDKIELEKKTTRQVISYNDYCFLQSRLYPAENDTASESIYTDIREIVQKIFADCLEVNNLWVRSKNDVHSVVRHGEYATCYPDWQYNGRGNYSISTLKERTSELQRKIVVGAQPICIECGERHYVESNINCCRGGSICEGCGERYNKNELCWCEGSDGYYCDNCSKYCDFCDQYEYEENGEEVNGIFVCKWCLDDYFTTCEDCGCYIHKDDDAVEIYDNGCTYVYCPSCADQNTFECDICGEMHHNDNCNYDEVEDRNLCNSCYEEVLIEREEELEVKEV